MDLPPLPDKARIAVEESDGVLHISWPVRGGEFLRKLMVGLSCLGIAGNVWLLHESWHSPGRHLGLWIALILIMTFWGGRCLALLANILTQAEAPGHAHLKLSSHGFHFAPGAGMMGFILEASRILTVSRTGFTRVDVHVTGTWPLKFWISNPFGCLIAPHKHVLQTPGEAEASWLAETLQKWRLEALAKRPGPLS